MDYDDPVKFVRDCHQHVLDTGHQVLPADAPLRHFMGYICAGCEDAQEPPSWCCSARSLKALQGQSMEAELLRVALGSSGWRKRLTDYLNSRTPPRPVVILSRYERPWVI